MKKIGILYICTGKYSIFWKDFYLSMEKNFIEDSEKHYFVFTDNAEIDFEKENPRIHKIYQKNLGWPDNTLKRFHVFLKYEKELQKMNYLFFFNANLIIIEEITAEEFIPTSPYKLVATMHPGFYNKNRKKFAYEKSKDSTAYVEKDRGENYFAGGLNGGTTEDFIKAMKIMRDNIDTDTKNSIIAKWHDESHWNKYLVGRNDIKILQPSYLYPEGWIIPFMIKILVLDKNKHGGHTFLRNEKGRKLKIFYKKIKKVLYELNKKYLKLSKSFFILEKPQFSNIYKFNLNKSKFILITIAFNNSKIIRLQYSYLSKNLKEKFDYIVVDNSNLKNVSNEIYEYCTENNIPYVKLPVNQFLNNPSKSHGSALNWSYYNIIKILKPTFWGFIDHDIFPFKETSITPFIKKELFGLIQERGRKWYLWPGFCFYKYSDIEKYKLDFMPCSGLDTGGVNYYFLYKKINRDNIYKIRQIYFDLDKKERVDNFDNSKKIVEIIGDWIHIMRISNWNNKNNNKNNILSDIINVIKNNFN